MIFEYFFLLKESNQLLYSLEMEPDHNIIIPLSTDIDSTKKDLFEFLYSRPNNFCFLIRSELIINARENIEAITNFITSFFFLPSYMKNRNSFLLLIEYCSDQEKNINNFKSGLKTVLDKQVASGVEIILLESNSIEDITGEVFVSKQEFGKYLNAPAFDTNQENFLISKIDIADIEKKWIIPIDSNNDLIKKSQAIKHFENLFFSVNPLLTELIRKANSRKNKLDNLISENELLKMKLKNAMENLKVLKDTANGEINHLRNIRSNGSFDLSEEVTIDELRLRVNELESTRNRLQEWYNQQYEELPVWYKRFGHLIKVVKGKRSFKSLFK